MVASDYTAVHMLVGEHRLTPDLGTAATMLRESLTQGSTTEVPSIDQQWPLP